MALPTKEAILRRARRIELSDIVRQGLPAITPEEHELKESGVFHRARIELMRVDQQAKADQERYLQQMATEMKLKVIPRRALTLLKKETGYEWTNGWTHHKKRIPRKKASKPRTAPRKPRRKARHRPRRRKALRTQRKPKRDGKKLVSFPDDIWKVKSPRKRRRR